MPRTKITAYAAETAFNAGLPVYKGQAKKAPALLKGRTGDTWQEALDTYGGHTRRAWFLD